MKNAITATIRRFAVRCLLAIAYLTAIDVNLGQAQENLEHPANYYFKRLQVEDGLSQNTVYAILQDSQGYLWFGTQDGLNRYDGRNFKVFKRNNGDSTTIGNNTITAIAKDRQGNLWVGTGDGAYVYNYQSEQFRRYLVTSVDGEQVTGVVRDIQVDAQGNVWMAVFNKGVFRASSDGRLIYFNLAQGENPAPVWIRRIAFDKDGNVWIGTYQQGMYSLNAKDGSLAQYLIQEDSATGEDNDVNDIVLLDTENLLVGTSNRGVQQFNLRTKTFSPLLERDAKDKPLYVRRLIQSQNGELWIGTESGLFIYHLPSRKVENLRHISGDNFSITDNAIHSVYEDREGGMWLGTYFGGINYYIQSYSLFEKYYPSPQEHSLQGKSISEFCEVDDGTIWIGTEDAGLHTFNPVTKRFAHGYLPASNIHALMHDRDKLWIGSFTEGLFILNLSTKRFKQYKNSPIEGSLINNNVYAIHKDYTGTVWVGTMMGLCWHDEATDAFIPVQSAEITTQVNDIVEDRWGTLWVATIGGGIYAYEKNTDTWRHYPTPIAGDASSGRVTCLVLDQQHRLWAGTEGAGIFRYDRATGTFTGSLSEDNGLPNNVIYRLVEDLNGHIWGSTNSGLFKLDTKDGSIAIFTHANGLLGDQFNYKSGFRSHTGKLFFGGIKGFVAFAPYTMWVNEVPPPVVINSIQFSDTELVGVSEVEIPQHVSLFSINFAALSFVSPRRNQYAYMLADKDKEWIFADGQTKVTYSNLPPGDYVFRVKASNSDGVWNEQGASLQIRVLPPFYRTTWAYGLYLLLFSLATYGVVRYFIRRIQKRNMRMLQTISQRKENELYNAKIEFFTNITHELRTPLSLIKAPLEEIMKQTAPSDASWENLSIMERNTNRLLKLVNELLDFRKAESKGIAVHFATTDMLFVINETIKRFQSSASVQDIDINLNLPEDSLLVDLDVEIFTKILSNLLHNSLKHASRQITLSVQEMPGYVRVAVENDGERIDPELADRIFLPFFKLDEKSPGSGLGLAFSKSLAELHNGNLYLDDENLTVFVLELPLRQAGHHRWDDRNDALSNTASMSGADDAFRIDTRKTVLMAEDNVEFQQFLAGQLQEEYQLVLAGNGREALDILKDRHVDMVISDIIMPVMDGVTLCKHIKEDVKFSHIPVILLTAKTGMKSKIDGLKVGADEYIDKPYSIDYLRARIENLLESRRKIREAYHTLPETAYESIAHSKADQRFLDKLVEAIHAHLDQTDLDVDKLAGLLNMSRATFYRKVKNISELTPNDFIRVVRLKKAAELLKAKDYRISEIAYLVGFTSPSYFSKCFQQQFGVLPKDFERAPGKVPN